MSIPIRYWKGVTNAEEIASAVERAVIDGVAHPGDPLPTVRALSTQIGLSPGTVAAAYRALGARGIAAGQGRAGTRITAGPPLSRPAPLELPEGVRDLATGNPDPALLPALRPILRRIDPAPVTYGEALVDLDALRALGVAQLQADGVPAERVVIVSGALDGVERVLQSHLRPGDRVAVEDPGFARVFDLVAALGLIAVPVPLDDRGLIPDALAEALGRGLHAVVVTPRAQNPTGAALDDGRVRALQRVLRAHPDVLVVEDDHAGPIAGAPAHTLATATRTRWAVVRSVAKSLGPDVRLAVLSGDRITLDRVEGRLRIGPGWVSRILQLTVAELWADPGTTALLERAERTYAERRTGLIDALSSRNIAASGRSGLNVWVPVTAEAPVVSGMLGRGWAIAAGERFRDRSGPAVRITVASLPTGDIVRVADDLASLLHPAATTSA
jgi:DNA-binding transcriptional MocR family regulator